MEPGVAIERLRDAARALRSFDDRAALKAIQAAQDALDAAKADRPAALEESREFELDGASSLTTWARRELRLDAVESKKLVRAATTMRDLPAVGEAAAEGRIRLDHVAVFSYGAKHVGTEIVWSRGGHTDLDDMIGLCVRCHHLVHREHLTIESNGTGSFDFTTKNGRLIERPSRPRTTNLPPETARRTVSRVPMRT